MEFEAWRKLCMDVLLKSNLKELSLAFKAKRRAKISIKDMARIPWIEPGCTLYLDKSIKLSGKVPFVTFEQLIKSYLGTKLKPKTPI